MISDTDIPDWCYLEAGLPYDLASHPTLTPDVYKTMYEKSPVSVAHAVKTPVLLLLGKDDRRVPPSQGKNWGEGLKARGGDVEILVFSGVGHALDTVEAERIGVQKIIAFLDRLCV
jgi:dipeptidyl aminopeptidase/acylaminoacyl peptidase